VALQVHPTAAHCSRMNSPLAVTSTTTAVTKAAIAILFSNDTRGRRRSIPGLGWSCLSSHVAAIGETRRIARFIVEQF